MKKRLELDVDFIGGEQWPTKEQFLDISKYIKSQKGKPKMIKKNSKVFLVKKPSV